MFAPYSPWVDSVYWTLGIEIAFYAVVWTLLWLGRFHVMEVVAIVIGLISTLFWCLYYPLDWSEFAETRWLALLLVHHGCFFATGVMIWLMRFKAVTPFRLVLCALFRPADRQFGRCSHRRSKSRCHTRHRSSSSWLP
ncbi:hypothetical protein [Mesorhizobium sp. f-mel]